MEMWASSEISAVRLRELLVQPIRRVTTDWLMLRSQGN